MRNRLIRARCCFPTHKKSTSNDARFLKYGDPAGYCVPVGQQGVLGIVQIEDKQQSDAKCLQSYTRCITQAFASNRRTPKTSFRVLAHKLSHTTKTAHHLDALFCWWGQQGSNLWPRACKARALPAELYPQLVVTPTGFEPMLPPWKGDVLTTWPRGHEIRRFVSQMFCFGVLRLCRNGVKKQTFRNVKG